MPALSDCRFDALRAQGFTGATSDMLLQWLQFNGATAKAVPDAWKEMLVAITGLPVENYHRNDYWRQFLLGIAPPDVGTQMNDLELWFWCENGGIIGPQDGVTIVTQPAQVCFADAGSHSWTVVASSGDASPLSYQWEEDLAGSGWTPITDAPPLSGATTDTLTLNPGTFPDDDGRRFRCSVTNAVNTVATVAVFVCFSGVRITINTEDDLVIGTEDDLDDLVTEDSDG